MMGTLKRLVPYSSRQRLRKLINGWNSRPFEGAPTIDPASARALRRRYCDEILAVEEIIGRDLGIWRSGFLVYISLAHLLDLLNLLGLSLS
jgi:hypothetical protein